MPSQLKRTMSTSLSSNTSRSPSIYSHHICLLPLAHLLFSLSLIDFLVHTLYASFQKLLSFSEVHRYFLTHISVFYFIFNLGFHASVWHRQSTPGPLLLEHKKFFTDITYDCPNSQACWTRSGVKRWFQISLLAGLKCTILMLVVQCFNYFLAILQLKLGSSSFYN